ncbi:MAG: hypothetical protein KUL75_10010 [Sterolibacterium sp.]|nr:hypothetical protein [Sterolibacterium sp.]
MYDVMGHRLLDLETSLTALPDGQRPRCIIFVVITGSEENQSRKFGRIRLTRMIQARKQLG